MTASPANIVEIAGVTKRFPGVLALDRISVGFRAGEVHAVIGENGAGKSTLMNILAGDLRPDGGRLLVDGKEVKLASPLDSRAQGITVVYQELALCPTMSVADNIMMSDMAARSVVSLLPRDMMRREARAALTRLGMGGLDPDTKVGRLSVAEMQLVEIAGAVRQNARVLVLDEPNSALSKRESERLFEVVKQLRAEGVTIIYVSHHLREVLDIADRVTVMRDGRTIVTMDNEGLSEDQLIRAMVGRDLGAALQWSLQVEPRPEGEDSVLTVENLEAAGLEDVSFSVRAGEILGIGGLPDSGKDGLGDALFGLSARRGKVTIDGKELRGADPLAAIRLGMSFVPADRRGAGGLLRMSVADNVVSASLPRFSLAGFVRRGAVRREARAQVARLDARISHLGQKLGTLSGGNQQKIILGRSLVTNPRVLVLHEPTRGIDVGAKAEIYSILRGIAGEGMAIVMISSEIPELIMNAERVLVLRDGRLSGELTGQSINETAILARAMTS
ncbi:MULTISPECIES: sugar ABC transporter ATP-binding protein [unclassified Mesorhizobium]|uniref:sugar ABC transporter ATP-binding protein n=1 Tax=unclassified Mesorhizobium TaxID=325217 RepID=UPI000965C99E|nr:MULTISPECIES: sugar ABC transporter ATP-binding protein [unclassified Mesorhizobium]MBN9257112.1 sugar ABC transporter ATP-binding protein [Mesorhizobium sp.]OJX82982.1 MAG: sugar ABC transporter ATP-binding protein [Mesorhizobium sp. 65-26]